MNQSLFPLLALAAALAGCAGVAPEQPPTQVAAADAGQVCERGQSTGSKFIAVRCRSANDREYDRRDVESLSEAVRRTRSNEKPGR
jgi:hypothetical protein